MIVIVQLLLKYALLEPFGVQMALDGWGIILLIISTTSLAAAGNIINDIYDVDTDFINKPNKVIIGVTISKKTAYNLFITLNIIGVAIGFYISHSVGKPPFFILFVLVSVLLYVYSTQLKGICLIGNIVVSLLVALSVLIVGVFELIPTLTDLNKTIQFTFLNIILDYTIFAFMINLLREIAKDIEDIDGDHKAAHNTLPIAIGRRRARNLLMVLNYVPLVAIIYYIVTKLYTQQLVLIYFLIFVIAPLIYISIQLFNAKTKRHFHHIASMYKLVMFFGMLSLLRYPFIL